MTLEEFKNTLVLPIAPAHLSVFLKALWYDAKGDWHTAHELVDSLDGRDAARVHAYLHRVEGDLWNARYWYSRAKETEFEGSLDQEWQALFLKFA